MSWLFRILDSIRNNWSSAIVQNIVLAWFPAWILFVLFPTRLFLGNMKDFGSDYLILVPYLAVSVVWFGLSVFFNRSRTKRNEKVVALLFYSALYFLLADVLTPLPKGTINHTIVTTMAEPVFTVVFDIVLFIAFVLIAPCIPFARVKRFFFIMVIVFICSETGMSFLKLMETPDKILYARAHKAAPLPKEPAQTGNIYHFIFDGFSSVGMMELLDEMGVTDKFTGFVYYKYNRSNYLNTRMSVPSFLTGEIYRNNGLCLWSFRALNEGVKESLYRHGYQISYYGFRGLEHKKATSVVTQYDVDLSLNPMHMMQLGDLWLLHVVPQIWHSELFHDGRGAFSNVVEWLLPGSQARMKYRWILVLDRLMKDEETRGSVGNYVYSHVLIPHAPFELDEKCEPLYEELDQNLDPYNRYKNGYIKQARCSVRKMVEFLDVLRMEGKYKDSMIIIQSDHGITYIEDDMLDGQQGSTGNPIELKRPDYASAPAARSRSLLLVKQFGHETDPLEVSDRLTQLVDIPATLMNGIGESETYKDGTSVFSGDFPNDRTISIFSGFVESMCGRHGKKRKSTISRYSFTPKGGVEFDGNEVMEQ